MEDESSLRWWYAQAEQVGGRPCPHCRSGTTHGRYVVSKEGRGRAVEEHCLMCGWCEPVVTQEGSQRPFFHRQEVPRVRGLHREPRAVQGRGR